MLLFRQTKNFYEELSFGVPRVELFRGEKFQNLKLWYLEFEIEKAGNLSGGA